MPTLTNIGVSALLAYQRSLTTTGHNIANADTEGYSRQITELSTQIPELNPVGYLGSGVHVIEVRRMYDEFLAGQMRSTQSTSAEQETYFDHASRIDNIISDTDIGLDPAIQGFFNAMHVFADDPASIATRQSLLSESQTLVDRFHDVNRQFADARHQLNQELENMASEITSLAQSIALANQGIVEAIGASGGDMPNDLLDKRDKLLSDLSKLIDITVVPQNDGAWNIFVGKGQTLVISSTPSTISTVQGTTDPTQYEISFTSAAGSQIITDQISGGQIGGLLKFRDQILDPGQNHLGLLALGIADNLNAQHRLGLDLDGNFGGDLFSMASVYAKPNTNNGGTATVTGAYIDTGNLTTSDYELLATSTANEFVLTRASDGQTTTINTGGTYPYTTAEIDGFSLTITSGAVAGDRFTIRPTRDAAGLISMQVTEVRQFAGAGPLRAGPTTNSVTLGPNQGNAAITQPDVANTTNLPLAGPATITLEYGATANGGGPGFTVTGGPGGTIAYDPATQSNGANFTFAGYGGMTFTISGTPADGDRLVIENNTGGVGDNRNALKMADLQFSNTMLGQTGGTGVTATFQETYAQLVSDVGSKTRQAEVNFQATDGLRERHQNALLSVSGVNLDEEAAKLIKFQQAYQASAQIIAAANTVFDALFLAVRR